MKNKSIKLLVLSLLLVMGWACKKEENRVYFEGGTSPTLTASTTMVTLEPGLEANTALVLNWTNPDYKFTTGVSSQDVTYTLEIDTMGGNFSSGKKYTTVIAKDLTKTYTVAELNGILGNSMTLQLDPRRNYTLQARITSSIGSVVKFNSNAISFTTKPFAPPPKVEPPGTANANYADGALWIVGNAAPVGWTNPLPSPHDVTHKFTRLSKTLYELTISLPGGGGYKLIQEQGNWGTQYHMTTGTWDDGEFEKKDSDPQFPGPPTAGTYKITVNFQTGKYSVIKL